MDKGTVRRLNQLTERSPRRAAASHSGSTLSTQRRARASRSATPVSCDVALPLGTLAHEVIHFLKEDHGLEASVIPSALILRMQIAAMHDYADPATGCTGTYSADCPACIARKVRENKP